jgi:chromosome segregation ATPase
MSMKDAYEKKLRAELDEWHAEIEGLRARADKAEADARLKYYEHIEELRVRQEAAREKRDELQASGDDAFEDLKAGVDSARHSLANALRSAASRFR